MIYIIKATYSDNATINQVNRELVNLKKKYKWTIYSGDPEDGDDYDFNIINIRFKTLDLAKKGLEDLLLKS